MKLTTILKVLFSSVKETLKDNIKLATSPKRLIYLLRNPLYKNSLFLLISSATTSILGFFFWMLAARLYTPVELGIATALISAMTLLAGLSILGFNVSIIRFLPDEQDKGGMINSCLTITVLFSILLALVFVAGTGFWSPDLSFIKSNAGLVLVFVLFTIATSLVTLTQATFLAFRRAEYSFTQSAIASGLKIILVIFFISLGAFGILSSWGISAIIAIALSLFVFTPKLHKGYFPVPKIAKRITKELFHFSVGNYIADNLWLLPKNILPLLVLAILGAELTAYFYIGWSIASVLFMIPTAVVTSLFVEGSHNRKDLRATTIKAIKFAFLFLIPAIIVIFLLGEKILLLFGKVYSDNAFNLLLILAVSTIPDTFVESYVAIERIRKRVKPIILYYGLLAILTLGIGYILIPRIGIIGAGVGWLLAQGIVVTLIGLQALTQWRKQKFEGG